MKRYFISTVFLVISSMAFSQKTYNITGKLIATEDELQMPAYCGYLAIAKAFKFKVISSEYPGNEEYIIIIVPCPREMGGNFFVNDADYEITAVKENTDDFGWTILNDYEDEGLTTLWSEQMKRVFQLLPR